jgi:dTDP-glucose 4,6-dehydratase
VSDHCLVTGAGGFLGHHILSHLLTETSWDITATDSFRHKGTTDRIGQVLANRPEWRPRVEVVTHDLVAPFSPVTAERLRDTRFVIAAASQSHVDRSIKDPVPFVENNVAVMLNTLELCRQVRPEAVIVVSTDEVYGPVTAAGEGWPEWSPVIPSNPYAASKAAQEAIAIAYWRTYGLPVIIVNCMNLFGERQDPEKFLPLLTARLAAGKTVPVHGRPGDIGSRHYLHARNLADALLFLLRLRKPAAWPDAGMPDRYNVASPEPVSNLALAGAVADILGRMLRYELVDFHSARPGHDAHYGLDSSKLSLAGWKPPVDFRESLERTVLWSMANPEWLA